MIVKGRNKQQGAASALIDFGCMALHLFFLLLISPLSYARAEQASHLQQWLSHTQIALPAFNSSFGDNWHLSFTDTYCTGFTGTASANITHGMAQQHHLQQHHLQQQQQQQSATHAPEMAMGYEYSSGHKATPLVSMDASFASLDFECYARVLGESAPTNETYRGGMHVAFDDGFLSFNLAHDLCPNESHAERAPGNTTLQASTAEEKAGWAQPSSNRDTAARKIVHSREDLDNASSELPPPLRIPQDHLASAQAASPCVRASKTKDKFTLTTFQFTDDPPPSLQEALEKKLPALKLELDALLDVGFIAAVDVISDDILSAILRAINTFVDEHNVNTTASPPVAPNEDTVNLLDFPLFKVAEYITDDMFERSQWFTLHQLVAIITEGTGTYKLQGLNSTLVFPVNINETVQANLTINEVEVGDLFTLNVSSLVRPISPTRLKTLLTSGNLTVTIRFGYQVRLLHTPLITNPTLLIDAGEASLALSDVAALLDIDLLLSSSALSSINPEDLYSKGCFPSTINFTQIADIGLHFNLDDITLALSDEAQGLDSFVTDVLYLLMSPYSPLLDTVTASIMNTGVRQQLNVVLDNWVSAGRQECSRTSSQSWDATYIMSGVCALLLVGSIVAICAQQYDKHHQETIVAVSESKPLLEGINFGDEKDAMFRPKGKCLANEPAVSIWARYLMPVLILATVALLVMADTRVSGSAYFNFVLTNGTEASLPIIKTLEFTRTVKELFQAKVYPLAVCIVVFSGAWPYLKLAMLLYAWVAPTKYMPVHRREVYLQVLDFLGKWSVMDIYVSIMLIVGMHFHVPLMGNASKSKMPPAAPFLLDEDTGRQLNKISASSPADAAVAIDLWVEPNDALYFYWATIMISLLLTHWMLYLHRRVLAKNGSVVVPDLPSSMLVGHSFYSKFRFFQLTSSGRVLLGSLILVTIGATLFGAISTAFAFHFEGMAAWLTEVTADTSMKHFSLASLIDGISSSSKNPDAASTWFIQVVFALFALALPLLQQVLLFALWFFPMKPRGHQAVLQIVEIVHAWAALEVFVLAIIVTVLQLEPLSEFIIGDKCNGLNVLLKLFLDKELNGVDKCFAVSTQLLNGCWILVSCCFVSFFSTIFSLSLGAEAVRQRTGFVSTQKRRDITFTLGSRTSTGTSSASPHSMSRSTLFSSLRSVYPSYYDPSFSSSRDGDASEGTADPGTSRDAWTWSSRLGLSRRVVEPQLSTNAGTSSSSGSSNVDIGEVP